MLPAHGNVVARSVQPEDRQFRPVYPSVLASHPKLLDVALEWRHVLTAAWDQSTAPPATFRS
ncbi:MAG: hypothetical protein MZW92_22730 [Comamonadaceae bacterium]|nr:hypothetical protein [Comamonadaceae bacterium]